MRHLQVIELEEWEQRRRIASPPVLSRQVMPAPRRPWRSPIVGVLIGVLGTLLVISPCAGPGRHDEARAITAEIVAVVIAQMLAVLEHPRRP